jgi:hypothetical protein
MKKQTAVELLQQELHLNTSIPNDLDLLLQVNKICNQAKEMEKQQIIEAYASGVLNECSGANITSEQYYNETYKTE